MAQPYLPREWSSDAEMAGYMSALKLRDVNPTNYDRIVEFWKKLIEEYCRIEKKCLIGYDELKIRFKRGNQLPAPLEAVLEQMYNHQIIVPGDELSTPRKGWLEWGSSLLSKSSWLTGAKIDFKKTDFVHIPTLKAQAKQLLEFYNEIQSYVDYAEIISYDELKHRCGKEICDLNCFDYIISELIRQGEVSEGTSSNGERILKFKDQTSKGPAKFTSADASVHELRKTMNKVDTELRRIEARVKKFDQEAREAVHRKDKQAALQALRKKKRTEKEMQEKDLQYQRLVGMFEQLAASKQTNEILSAYKMASKAYKEALDRQGLTLENVDNTMDSIHEAIQDANDVDEALHSGFSSMPMPASHIDDSALEDELKLIMEDEKRAQEPTLPDLPKVPTGQLFESNVTDRLKRLREGLSK